MKCIVCENGDPAQFGIRYKKQDYHVVQCRCCGFWFVPSQYRRGVDYTLYKSPETAQEVAKADLWMKKQRNLLRFHMIRKIRPSGSILDIGCGFGHFLLTGKELGYRVSGVEMSTANADFIRQQFGISVMRGDFLCVSVKETVDIVTLWDTLEHMDHADLVMEKISRVLKPGGMVFIQVPQTDSFLARLLGDKWWAIGLDHVNYFSRNTIRLLLERFGMEVVDVRSSIELKNILVYVLLPKLKRKRRSPENWSTCDRQREFNRMTRNSAWIRRLLLMLHQYVYYLFSFLHIGDEMVVTAVTKVRAER